MNSITLGTLGSNIAWLGAFIGGIILLLKYLKKVLDKAITEPILNKMNSNKKDLELEIENLSKKINVVGADQCKNYLVRYLADVEDGEEVSEVETERAHDAYEKYTKLYHGNSYIHNWWDKVMNKGRRKKHE